MRRTRDGARRAPRSTGDAGLSLIEVLIAIVLLGSVVTAGLTLLTGTINGTVLDRDHSNAHAWLQTASDMLYAREPENCHQDTPLKTYTAAEKEARRLAIISAYQTTIQQTENPEDWPAGNITVVDLWFWHYAKAADNSVAEGWVKDMCTTDLQRLLLRVRNTDNRIVEEVEVIIGGD